MTKSKRRNTMKEANETGYTGERRGAHDRVLNPSQSTHVQQQHLPNIA